MSRVGRGVVADDAGVWVAFFGQSFGYDLARGRWIARSTAPLVDVGVTQLLPGADRAIGDAVKPVVDAFEKHFAARSVLSALT